MVIQRWQSVLLLVAVVMMGIFTFLSLGQIQLTDYTLNFTTLGFTIEGSESDATTSGYYMHTIPFFIVSLMSALIPAIAIFTYKNMELLRLQMRLCLIDVLFIIATAAMGFYYGYFGVENGDVSWSSLIIALPVALISVIMAYSRIKADRNKILAADRIR